MKFSTQLRLTALRASTFMPPPISLLWAVPSVAAQMITYRDHYPVAVYKEVPELSAGLSLLRWTEDPWDGKLDVFKHPTFMQEAMAIHRDYSDDCDGFAAYSCVALLKSNLASEVYFASAQWVDAKSGDITGHAVCVYRDQSGWNWIGNWNRCQPIPCVKDGWVADMENKLGGPKIIIAQQWEAIRESHDSLLLGKGRVLRR